MFYRGGIPSTGRLWVHVHPPEDLSDQPLKTVTPLCGDSASGSLSAKKLMLCLSPALLISLPQRPRNDDIVGTVMRRTLQALPLLCLTLTISSIPGLTKHALQVAAHVLHRGGHHRMKYVHGLGPGQNAGWYSGGTAPQSLSWSQVETPPAGAGHWAKEQGEQRSQSSPFSLSLFLLPTSFYPLESGERPRESSPSRPILFLLSPNPRTRAHLLTLKNQNRQNQIFLYPVGNCGTPCQRILQ